MATRKRRRSTKRRTVGAASNPVRRRRRTTSRRPRRASVFARRRAANPVRRRIGRRRRNPIGGGVIGEAVKLAGSGIVIGIAQPFVRSIVGGLLPGGPIASAGVTLATAYGLGFVANMFGFTRNFRRPLELAGWTIAATQLASAYVLPMLRLNGGAAQANGMGRGRGFSGIAAVHGVPPQIVPLPPPPSRVNGGMAGVAGRPGQWAY